MRGGPVTAVAVEDSEGNKGGSRCDPPLFVQVDGCSDGVFV